LCRDAEIASTHSPVAHKQTGHVLGCIDCDREAESLSGKHRRIDTDDLAVGSDERAAGVAGIEGCVGLNDVVHQPARLRTQRPSQRADDPGRYRVGEAERIADRDDQLPGAQRRRIAERRVGQIRCVDAQHGQVGMRIVADQRRGKLAAVEERDPNPLRLVNHVAVGENEAVGRKNEAAAVAAAASITDLDADDRRADALGRLRNRLRIRVERPHAGG